MIVFEIDIAAVGAEELGGGHVTAEVFVVFYFFARGGVDEGGDYLEEAPDEPGDCGVGWGVGG